MKLYIMVDRNETDEESGTFTWQIYIIEKPDGSSIETTDWARVLAEAELLKLSVPEPIMIFTD